MRLISRPAVGNFVRYCQLNESTMSKLWCNALMNDKNLYSIAYIQLKSSIIRL